MACKVLSTVRDDLCVDLRVTLEKTEDDGLPSCTTSTLAPDAMRAEVRFINFDFTIIERRLAFAFFSNALTDFAKDRDD
jgi:hypothetical protein